MKILVVDDTEDTRMLLSLMLEAQGHEVIEAADGREALERFEAERPDLVLLDVIMPVMDGYETAPRLKAAAGDRHVPVILLTALSDDESLEQGLSAGGDDFISKPVNETILKAKITAHARIQDLNSQINEKKTQLARYKAQQEHEHRIASHVFHCALAQNQLDAENLRYHIAPASTFNGDLLLGAASPTGELYIFLGDFTGHGLAASIGALPVSQSFFSMAHKGLSLDLLAVELNQVLVHFLPESMFCAATLAHVDQSGHAVDLWCGGLPDAWVIGAGGEITNRVRSFTMPLGVLERDEFEPETQRIHLGRDERLYLFTDGVTECMTPEGEMFGQDRAVALLREHYPAPLDPLMARLGEFHQGQEQDDDISIIELAGRPLHLTPHWARPQPSRADSAFIPGRFELDLGPEEILHSEPVPILTNMMTAVEKLASHRDYLSTILSELYVNALDYGLLQLDSGLKATEAGYEAYCDERNRRLGELNDGFIQIRLAMLHADEVGQGPGEEGDLVMIRVTNSGPGFDYEHLHLPTTPDTSSRGLPLVASLCEALRFTDDGRTVEARYRLS